MLGNFINNFKNRLMTRVSDESLQSHFYSSDGPRTPNIFFKLVNASYALVNTNQDDSYCSDNLFMLPRVYLQKTEGDCSLWSPVSLKAPEKSLDELDNVVEKFIRCISVENYCDDKNVNRMKNEKVFPIFANHAPFIEFNKLINGFFPIFSLLWQRKNDREAIRRRLAMGEEDDYFSDLAASRPIRKPNLQSRLQNGSY